MSTVTTPSSSLAASPMSPVTPVISVIPAAPVSPQRPIVISMGDPAGIGPEIIAKVFRDEPALLQGCVVAGDVAVLRRAAQCVGGLLPVAVLESLADVAGVPPRCLPVIQACAPFAAEGSAGTPLPAWGQVNVTAGRAAADCIAWGARAALRGDAAALVTAPIHKEAFSAAGLHHPGHTEYLQALAAEHLGVAVADLPVRMMLANPELQTVLVSIHVSLRQAIDAVTVDNVLQTLRIVQASLGRRTAGGRPLRIAVAGLNPHAGEGGLFGREELDTIAPAIAQARQEGVDAHGPFAPDTVFMRARTGEFDVVVAMYHDQGLIPVKYLGVAHGVNVTLGLPLVRTSPDHGTAFDVAGTGQADPSSLLAAIRWARSAVGG
jgi:4-hydroxythreonine-4-phosphate dehydrogenase